MQFKNVIRYFSLNEDKNIPFPGLCRYNIVQEQLSGSIGGLVSTGSIGFMGGSGWGVHPVAVPFSLIWNAVAAISAATTLI